VPDRSADQATSNTASISTGTPSGSELVQAHDDREAVQVSPDELPVIDIPSL
jgi:hypothetical protein